jgi:hypothetical protein
VFDKIIQTALDNSAIPVALYSTWYIGSDFAGFGEVIRFKHIKPYVH